MRKFVLVLVLVVSAAEVAFAQEIVPKNDDWLGLPKERTPFMFDWGGNFSPTVMLDKSGSSTLSMSATNLNVWARLTLPGDGALFLRGRDTLMNCLYQKAYPAEKHKNLYDLDAAYYEFKPVSSGFSLSLGRKLYLVGSGTLLSGTGDGVEANYVSPLLQLKLFGMYTGFLRKDYNPYGLNSTDYNVGARRLFAGGTLRTNIGNQTPFLMGLYQKDYASNATGRYDSWYGGAGIKGVLSQADYFVEGYFESGKSYFNDATGKSSVTAFGAAASLNYYFKVITSPSVSAQYGIASGDKDRINTEATGNISGSDNGFISFGYFPAGLALRPTFSNIQIFRAGAAFNPFERLSDHIRKITIDAKYSYYMKCRKKGVINSGEATNNSYDVGHGIDTSLRWAPFSDFTVYVMYGLFIPGKAYSTREPKRNFAVAGASLSF